MECENCDEVGCPECQEDLAYCEECGALYELAELDDDLWCDDCRQARDDRRELASDYRSMVL